jgi:hypothetical protein
MGVPSMVILTWVPHSHPHMPDGCLCRHPFKAAFPWIGKAFGELLDLVELLLVSTACAILLLLDRPREGDVHEENPSLRFGGIRNVVEAEEGEAAKRMDSRDKQRMELAQV